VPAIGTSSVCPTGPYFKTSSMIPSALLMAKQ
jgi:hypothetical protein